MSSGGSDPTRLTRADAPDNAPAWSPDGEWIVFTSDRDGGPEVYLMRADGSEQTRLTFDDMSSTGNARWLRADALER